MVQGLWLSLFFAHPFHASIAKAEYNYESKSLQVVINTFTDDVLMALTHFQKESIKDPQTVDKFLPAYLQQHLTLQNSKGKLLPMTYIGSAAQGSTLKVYVEFFCSWKELQKTNIQYSLLFQEFDDQVNTVNIYVGSHKQTLVFTPKETQHFLTF